METKASRWAPLGHLWLGPGQNWPSKGTKSPTLGGSFWHRFGHPLGIIWAYVCDISGCLSTCPRLLAEHPFFGAGRGRTCERATDGERKKMTHSNRFSLSVIRATLREINIYRRPNHMDWQIDSFGPCAEVGPDPGGWGPASLWPCQWPKKAVPKCIKKSNMKKHEKWRPKGAKMSPKWMQKRIKNQGKTCYRQKWGKSWFSMASRCVKSCKSTILSSKNKVSQDECENPKDDPKTIKNETKTLPESMKKRCKFHARKRWRKKHEKSSKMAPQRAPKSGLWPPLGRLWATPRPYFSDFCSGLVLVCFLACLFDGFGVILASILAPFRRLGDAFSAQLWWDSLRWFAYVFLPFVFEQACD